MMPQNINLIPQEPRLKDLLDLMSKQIKLDFNSHHIGTIQSFNALTQTAEVSINYTKTLVRLDEIGNQIIETPNYPILVDCPVICLGGGGGSLTFPIEKGDECLVMFNDRDFDNWFGTGSSSSPPLTGRLHAFSDAIVLVGLRSLPNALLAYSTDSAQLKYKNAKIQVKEDSVLITITGSNPLAPTTFELSDGEVLITLASGVTFLYGANGKLEITNTIGEFVSLLSTLFTDIQNGLVTTMLGPQPLVMPTFAVDLALFDSFKS